MLENMQLYNMQGYYSESVIECLMFFVKCVEEDKSII